MENRKKVILSSIITIVLCLSLIAGSTFAIFTSEEEIDIAVTSGKVQISAVLDTTSIKTRSEGMAADQWNSDGSLYGGKAEILTDGANRGYLQVTKMIPGDSVKVTVDVTNSSNVPVKFKIAMEGEDVLIDALAISAKITVDGTIYTISGDSETDWLFVGINADGTGKEIGDVEITVTFPHAVDNNDYQNKDAKIKLMLIAVQGNGDAIYDAEHTTSATTETETETQ